MNYFYQMIKKYINLMLIILKNAWLKLDYQVKNE
jgi:hypothetical protein